MKKLSLLLALLLVLTGCRTVPQFQPDTIVDIPLEPTQAETQLTEPETEAPTETEPVTEILTEPAAEKPTEQPKKSSSSGSSNKKQNSTTKPTEKPFEATKPTEPPTDPATEPPTEPETEAPTDPVVTSYAPTSLDYAFVDAINAQRIEAGLPALSMDSRLCIAAAQRACELPISWSHTRPDGRDFTTVLHDMGYRFSCATENLYNTDLPFSADSIVSRWMNSDSYRANLLSESATSIGVANHTADGFTYIAILIVG